MLVMVYEKPKLAVVLPTHFSQEGHSRSVSPWGLFLECEGIRGFRNALLIYHSFIALMSSHSVSVQSKERAITSHHSTVIFCTTEYDS